MAENKKQHYVPQFYLKNFSSDNRRRSINMYNVKRKIHAPTASIKNQCYKDYFYGIDGFVENAFSNIEGEMSGAFRAIIRGSGISLNVYRRSILTLYICLQNLRTVSAEEASNEMANHALKTGLSKKFPREDLENFSIRVKNASSLNVRLASANSPMLWDLSFAFLINKSSIKYITSDSPVVLANKFHRRRKYFGGGLGLATAGLTILFPISPKVAILLYDRNIYSCAKGGRNEAYVKLESDVETVNRFQILNCFENIYFSDCDMIEYIKNECESLVGLRE